LNKIKRRYIKYQNRKLHEEGSQEPYISGMEELAEAVARGDEVEVVDDLTGEDVTLSVLARIIYDLSRVSLKTSTVAVLSQLIVGAKTAGAFPDVWPGYGRRIKRRRKAVPKEAA
jgi:polyhydroxyalkanoate synthesis regulator protein